MDKGSMKQRIVDTDTGVWVNIFKDGRVQIGRYQSKAATKTIQNYGDIPSEVVEVKFTAVADDIKKPAHRKTDLLVS